MILVTGATGQIGRELVRELGSSRARFRALVRSSGKAETVRAAGGEAVVGDFTDPGAVRGALAGIRALFLLTPTIPDKVAVESRIAEEAKKAGVSLIVKLSALGADAPDPPIFGRLHREVELRIEELGIARTFLRPSYFMQNYLLFADTVRAQGAIFAAAGQGRHADIDVRDIAAVAARVLTEEGHEGRTYALTGPEAQSLADAARKIATIAGREVRFVDVPPEDARKTMTNAGLSEWMADALNDLYAWYQRGEGTDGSAVTQDVEEVLGRPPRAFEPFVRENVQAFGG
ncbi:MAG TPA: SDR family oxidoreductase [Thermoanaerobaculia bacterium]|jgi:uncharacterized protein YbjT (DUF2867 family)|nr:SDR family oxidoreductase [Thermoanaerobaculia bacterium]